MNRVVRTARWARPWLVSLLLWTVAPWVIAATPDPQAIRLEGGTSSVDLWPAVTVREDADAALSFESLPDAAQGFERPRGAASTLGVNKGVVWLRAGLATAGDAGGEWVIDIDYPALHRVDLVLLRDGRSVHRATMGAHQVRERDQGRSLATMVRLEAGVSYELLLRVQTDGARILPISVSRPATFHADALQEQMLQGLLTGLGGCLILYSLIQWLVLRERMFGKYALMTGGSVMFSVAHFGIGAQFLWPGSLWMNTHVAGLAALLATCGSFLFIGEVLDHTRGRWWLRRAMNGGALLMASLALLFALDWIGPRAVAALVSGLGLVPVLLGIPVALRRAWRGDRLGANLLAAWVVYFVATAVMIGVINAQLPANFWTMHAFQFGATLDMLLFMRVLGLRMAAVQSEARSAHRERDVLRSLAQRDPLTGLYNRRGMEAVLAKHLPEAGEDKLLAVYLMDLDGFKAVNDRHGHAMGDQLLVFAGQRLRHCLRERDHVIRLGGDEFVVVATGLADERQAQDVGLQLLHRFERPFKLGELQCEVGTTIGYAIAPLDGHDAAALLKLADQAMYEGKQSGKRCLRRATPAAPAAQAASPPSAPTAVAGST